MPRLSLSATLLGISQASNIPLSRSPQTRNTETLFFIEKGHIMEILDLGHPYKRTIALFFGPKEFAIRCHSDSDLKCLDKVAGNPFTHGMVFQTLRKFPESRLYYQQIRQAYQAKVTARVRGLQTMTGLQRYEELKNSQPWVLKLAEPIDIALYLRVSVSDFKRFQGK